MERSTGGGLEERLGTSDNVHVVLHEGLGVGFRILLCAARDQEKKETLEHTCALRTRGVALTVGDPN